jgi:DNA-binding IscR family transcriptional regulator
MLRVLRKLQDIQLVKEIGGEWAGLVPGCDPDRITVEEVVLQMEGVQHAVPDIGPDDRERAFISEIFNRLTEATKNALNRMTIGQLVRDFYALRAPSRIEDRFTNR